MDGKHGHKLCAGVNKCYQEDVIETDPGRPTSHRVARKGFSEDKTFELRLTGRREAGQEHTRPKKWQVKKPGGKTGFGSLERQKRPVGVQMQLVRVEVTERR